jgi:ribosomal-protein-alanine N-acetyltransferase
MAVFQSIRSLFVPLRAAESDVTPQAPLTSYSVRPLTSANLPDLMRVNMRCFTNGDNYNKHTFNYLLNEPATISYKAVTPSNELVGFVFVMVNPNGAAHLTTIGVAPEHRRRGVARRLMDHLESALRAKGLGTIMLEVRVSNTGAQRLYREAGFAVVQRIESYYSNGEDCYLMMKPLN